MAKIRRHVYIEGRVQGVGFRASVRHKADELNVKGWIKNLYNGNVEAVFSGKTKDVNKILDYVRKGPRFASVNNIEIHKEEYTEQFHCFNIKY